MSQHLCKYSRSYAFFKKYVEFAHSIYYSEICVINPGHIPHQEPVIFAPNHQNGLMDALAVVLTMEYQPVFMARADIFSGKMISNALHFFKIIPVFRLQDGTDKMGNNDKCFDIALQALGYGQPVVIMPEGTHAGERKLKPLKKGIARLALHAQETFGTSVNVKIVPVGIEYDRYNGFRGKLLVIYGKPIDAGEYLKTFRENSQAAYNLLRDRLAAEMKEIMLNISSHEYYHLIFTIKEIYANKRHSGLESCPDFYNRFLAEKQITDQLVTLASADPAKLDALNASVNEYTRGVKRLGLADWVFDTQIPDRKTYWFDIARYLFFLPLFAFVVLVNAIPAVVCHYFSHKAEDPQFRSSFKFALGVFVFPLFYLIILALPIPMLTKLIIILPMPVLLPLAYDYYISLRKQWIKFRYFTKLKAGDYELNALRRARERILQALGI